MVANFVFLGISICCRSQFGVFKKAYHKMVKQTQTIRWQQPANCLSMFDHFVGLPSLCWIAYGQIIHLFVEGLLPPIGTTPLCFKVCFFYVSEVHVNMSDHRVIFQCHVITCMVFISWRLFFWKCSCWILFGQQHRKYDGKLYEHVCNVKLHNGVCGVNGVWWSIAANQKR